MDNSQEYVLQVFRRAQAMLEDDIAPEHVAYLVKLGHKFELTSDLRTEIVCLNFIQGFSKAGIAFEWLLGRSKRDFEFSLEQFDADVQMLYDALHVAFTAEGCEPFALDEETPPQADAGPAQALPPPDRTAARGLATGIATAVMPPDLSTMAAATPSFTDLLDHPMLLTVRRLADSAAMFGKKGEGERATTLAVLKMMAKNVVDMARPQNKVVVTGTFIEIASLIEAIERRGLMKDTAVARDIGQLGTMLSYALHDMSSGIRYMQEITEFIHETKKTRLK